MTLKEAQRLLELAFGEGEARGVTRMSVVVTDSGGHPRAAARADGQGIFGIDTATAKAVTALGFNRSSLALGPLFGPEATVAIAAATGGRFTPLGGGVVVVDAAGAVVGAAAVSGGPPQVDHEIISAAVMAAGFSTLP